MVDFSLKCLGMIIVVHGNKSGSGLESRTGLLHCIYKLHDGHIALNVGLGSSLF